MDLLPSQHMTTPTSETPNTLYGEILSTGILSNPIADLCCCNLLINSLHNSKLHMPNIVTTYYYKVANVHYILYIATQTHHIWSPGIVAL